MDQSAASKISVPPVGIDRDFLDYADSLLDIDAPNPQAQKLLTARAAKRRAHFAKYVAVAVALAAIVCAAAVAKVTVARGHESLPTSAPR